MSNQDDTHAVGMYSDLGVAQYGSSSISIICTLPISSVFLPWASAEWRPRTFLSWELPGCIAPIAGYDCLAATAVSYRLACHVGKTHTSNRKTFLQAAVMLRRAKGISEQLRLASRVPCWLYGDRGGKATTMVQLSCCARVVHAKLPTHRWPDRKAVLVLIASAKKVTIC